MFFHGPMGIDLIKILSHFNWQGCFLQTIQEELSYTVFFLAFMGLVSFAISGELLISMDSNSIHLCMC
jgi:hypothetical protein